MRKILTALFKNMLFVQWLYHDLHTINRKQKRWALRVLIDTAIKKLDTI